MQRSSVGDEAKKPESPQANSPHLTAGQVKGLTRPNKGQPTTIVVTSTGSGANLSTLLNVPQAISGQSSANTAVCLANTRIISPQAINIIQRQIPASGVVGLSCVTAEGLQQVLQGTPLTLVTAASPEAAAVLDQQRKQSLLQQQRRQPHQQSGATIHHLGPRSLANPISNQHVSVIATMSNVRQLTGDSQSTTAAISSSLTSNSTTLKDVKPLLTTSMSLTRSATTPISGGPVPKKIKLEEILTPDNRIVSLRKSVSNHKRCRMRDVKSKYRDNLTELFYLQAGGNMVEFQTWRKRPTQPLLNFLEGSRLDSDDEDDRLQEKRINDEVKVLTSSGSNIPVATPVAIATTLPPSVSALSQQAMHSSSVTTSLITSPSVTSSELQQHLTKSGEAKSLHTLKGSSPQSSQPIAAKSIKSQSTSPGRSRQAIASVYENVTGSQDVIVERAKQEAQVIQRVNELRKEGLWSAKRLPRVQEPPRQKAHWDYLLEEMTWLAADFIQERKWKKATSRKIARMISSHFREKEMKEIKAEKEEAVKLKKIASQMAKMVKEFWNNIEKVVQYKQTTRLEEKKKKALDLHLNFIVDQTEKYSSWLTAGLQSDNNTSKASSLDSDGSDTGDVEFQPLGTASDDEETIEKEENEAGSDGDGTKAELEALKKESELPIEDLLKSLPKEMLDMPSSGLDIGESSRKDETDVHREKDVDFDIEGEDDCDEEETLDEQENHEKDYTEELDDLKTEGELSVEDLMKKYAGAYESDFEMPEEDSSGDEDGTSDEDESSGSEKETGESEEEEEEEMDDEKNSMENESDTGKDAVGLEFLVKEETNKEAVEQGTEKGPGKEFNDIAAAAQSLQPKGYTLETTEVKTKVPFLLKHTLREYQHVGLDWLATMHDKRLNGILADEMGLGKTIQTIALLAHLACEKGIWGPHLIVVPTSVMLNWEMEIKKWCPAFKILTYYGSIKERKLKRQGWTKTNAFHVCITSYKLVVQDHQAFRRKKWKYFILDEAQNIKNFKSQRWQMLLNFSSQRRLLLTGTPLQNSLMELWSLMHFLMPNVFQSHSEFKEWFSNPLTGMIEGSQEYNESLVRRLHKVLRPFLLRRLKNEVEKQMPQKFEHVVMCRLSKRQRFLYDDFMSQSKTKETLTSGHFMSVINILMQLRKVCNHPNLFDPRPVISPFKMEGIVYKTASLVANALSYNPFRDIDIYSLYPNLVDMETDLPAFVAERVKRLQAPRKLIEEIDSWPAPEPRPPVGQLKNLKLASSAAVHTVSASLTDSIASGAQISRVSSSSTIKATVAPTIQTSQTASTMNNIKLLLPSSSSPSAPQSILIPNPNGSGPPIILPLPTSNATPGASSVSSTSAAIAQAKLISSQLQSGLLHLVQTSSGHQVITVASTSASSSTSSHPIISSTSFAPSLTSTSSSNVSVLKIASSTGSQEKPVMKVTPFVISSSADSGSSTTSALSKRTGSLDATSPSVSKLLGSHSDKMPKRPVNRSELFLESLYRKKEERRRHILLHMARVNQQKCLASPVMGSDTRAHLQCFHQLNSSNCSPPSNVFSCKVAKASAEATFKWCDGKGYCNCLFAQDRTINHNHPNIFWRESCHLVNAVRSPEDHIKELHDILHRFVFVTPPVISPNIRLHVSHPNYTTDVKMEWCESHLKPFIHQHSTKLHPIQLRTLVQFPEPRLIQYDCGKLQTMDILLRKLKSGQHRVLIFTQMTKMLDVLEAFLNFHGHRYLRLDGTTRVEQRQFLMDRFNADPRIFCFILSTRSGGIGVNLTGADTVIFYDSDWNPTMDAQAQDRCHRIGQTRDVHIYRLVSEMTVEENILKKANQKRLLGDLAIEGGNFTTAFFKQQTISDLFAEPSGLQSLVEAKERRAKSKSEATEMEHDSPSELQSKTGSTGLTKKEIGNKREEGKKESAVLTQFEQALCRAEDETDAQAVKQVQAEQKAELAEFDENIPWDEREAELKKEEDEFSKVEMELAMLDKELTPIERYAVLVVEAQTESETAEELKMAEEDIENSKKDWELARLKALKEEEERKAELEEDEMLYIYSKDESQTFISDFGEEGMPMWCPPTPPQDDNDIYMDSSLLFLYDGHTMPEQSLPPIFVPKAHKKPKLETITTRKQKQRKEEMPRVPRSLFDKPKEVVNKQRKEAKIQRLRQNLQVPKMLAGRTPISGSQQTQPQQQTVIAKPEPDPTYPEWLVHEEWALLEAVQHIQKLNPDLIIDNPAQITNWDFVSDFVSVVGRIFRAPKHCRYQYENVVLPREDGRIMFNIKPKKSPKSIYKTKNTRPLRTEQLYSQEGLKNFSHLYKIRFEAMLEIGSKRPAPMRQTVNPSAKPTKHASVLGENGINYDSPLPPNQLAMRRAERIAMDKKKQQQQAAAAQQQAQAASVNVGVVDQATAQRTVQAGIVASGVTPAIQGQQLSSIVSVTSNTVLAGQVPKVAVGPGLTAVSIARTIGPTGNIIVNTPAGFPSGTFAALNKRMNQAAALPSTIAVSANLTPTIRGQRSTTVPSATAITMQEVGTIAVGGAASASTTTVTVTSQVARSALQTTVASPSLPAGTLTTQKLAAMATGTSGALQPQLLPHRSLTPQQINILRQNPLNIRGQSSPGTTQQLRAQKLLTAEQIRAQQLKHPQKVITQQLLVPVRGGHSILQGKQAGLLRTTAIPHEQLQALRMRTQIQTQQGKQLQTAQIIQGQVTAVGQSTASTSQSQVALVKSVSASPSVTVPMTLPVTGISVGQQRTVVASRAATVSQIQQQQRMQLLHQQRKAGGQQKVTGLSAGKAGQIPLLIPQNSKLNSQILQQIGLVNKPIQQIIAHSSNQPTIITQVSQAGGQPITHMVAKVSLTTGGQQTLSAGGTPITVTQVSSPTAQGVGLTVAGGQTAAKTAATITSLDSGGSSIQVHSVQPGQKTLGGLTQSLVTAQNVQVQQASSNAAAGTQVSQLLHVTPVSVGTIGATTLSATSTGHSTSITVPPTSQLVASSSALRGATTTLLTSTAPAAGGSNSTAPQISLVTSPVTALTPAATVSTVQVQAISTIDITGDGSTPTVSVASSLSSSLSHVLLTIEKRKVTIHCPWSSRFGITSCPLISFSPKANGHLCEWLIVYREKK